jgi:aminopeptidase N
LNTDTPTTVYLKDYREPDFSITHTRLEINLDFQATSIYAHHQVVRRNSGAISLELNCELMTIQSVTVDGSALDSDQYSVSDGLLTIPGVPNNFTLEINNTIDPSRNTALSGLYKSGDMLCTQCEAEGYRRITPGIDRPDNLTIYTVKLVASKSDFPVLLCNGNLVECGDEDSFSHYTIWHDPFPKPTYLFAIVAGILGCLEDSFRTMSGRNVILRFYARDKDIDKCDHAMESLKNSMRWDEQVYGREYDLDLFNVVAVDDFNMGAMENKSLNIFNTKYVLADSNMATDVDFQNVEGVIGHEYFHNWSGNRVTCRDWFQLSLKEGFTVFRDQEFSADMGSRGVKRIDDVNVLRAHQFREDAGPLAHPVRPDSYQEINNFYTTTIYNKGAEVVRMLHTIVGPKLFRKGTDLYFEKHDGQAVTTDDFVAAMEFASNRDLSQFKNWYSQAGTPTVEVQTSYSPEKSSYEITLRQSCPTRDNNNHNQPFVIPVKTALFNQHGEKLLLNGIEDEMTIILDQPEQTCRISGIHAPPIPSLLRGFSAPIDMRLALDDDSLEILLEYDDDPFNRWEAGQKLFLKQILDRISVTQSSLSEIQAGNKNERLVRVVNAVLSTDSGDRGFIAELLSLPSIAYISEQVDPVDPDVIERTRTGLKKDIALSVKPKLVDSYNQCQAINTGRTEPHEIAARSLRNTCLDYLNSLDDDDSRALCRNQLENARCMTDSASAITLICRSNRQDRQILLDQFYQQWKHEPLVVDKWLRAQAMAPLATTLNTVQELTLHPGFDFKNPNKVYALILGFTHGNPYCFHAADGSGYQFISNWVEKLDPINSQVAARLVSALNGWKKYRPDLRNKMKHTLMEISSFPNLSKDVSEIIEKNLR